MWLLALVALGSCSPEARIVRYKPFFSGLENVETQTPPVAERSGGVVTEVEDPSKFSIVQENPDGSKTLISRNGLHLATHIQRTLAEDDAKNFTGQLLSQITIDEFHGRGLDPAEAFRYLKPYEKDIAKLFARMPLGEHSPNVIMENIGRNMFRVRLTGRSADDLHWAGYDMVLEKGNWKLRWFVP